MKSIKFPNMFKGNSTDCYKADEYLAATSQGVRLLMRTERGEQKCDPYHGLTLLREFMFAPNDYVLREALIDMIYTQVAIFIPTVKIERSGVNVYKDKYKGKVYVKITGTNIIDITPYTTTLLLADESMID